MDAISAPTDIEAEADIELADPPRRLLSDRVNSLYKHGLSGSYLTAAAAAILVSMVASRSAESHLWYWLMAMGSVLILRISDVLSYRNANAQDRAMPDLWLSRFSIGVGLTVLTWDAFIWVFFPSLDLFSRSAVAVVFAVMASGSINTLSSVRWLGIAYSFAMLLPPSLMLLFNSGATSLIFGALGLTWCALLAFLVNNAHREVTHSLMLARQNRELTLKAQQRQLETLELNAELSLARAHLMESNASLEEKVYERTAELERLANQDALTGLFNRHCFVAQVQKAIEEHHCNGAAFAIYFVDLDRFKEINDGLGHPAGDLVLRTIADRIRETCGSRLVCGRWGGDEFVLLQTEVTSPSEFQLFGDLLLSRIGMPIDALRASVTVGASIGVSMYPENGATPDELVEHADIAVYKAKRLGRSCVCVYRPEWGQEARRRLELVQALRRAIESDALTLHYQPVITVPERSLFGLEALCRWNDPEHGAVSPGVFIPIAEESGLMPQLGSWVLRRACSEAQRMFPSAEGPTIAVNLSVAQLMSDGFVDEVRSLLASSGLAARRLELELTESLFAENIQHVKSVLQQLREFGIRISIDDFGTGYSSMAYLRRFPLDTLKIDRAFVKDLNNGGDAIFATIVNLARSLELEVIVEGVETDFELERVIALGGDRVQGYVFAKPMPASEVVNWSIAPTAFSNVRVASG